MIVKRWIALILALFCLTAAVQATVYFNNSEIEFNGLFLGNYAKKTLTITSDSKVVTNVDLTIPENLKNLVQVKPSQNLFVSKDSPLELNIIAFAPSAGLAEAAESKIEFLFTTPQNLLTGTGGEELLDLPIKISTSSSSYDKLEVKSVHISDGEEQSPLDLAIYYSNQGNKETDLILIVDIDGKEAGKFPIHVLAFSEGIKHFDLWSNLTIGMHSAEFKLISAGPNMANNEVLYQSKSSFSFASKGTLLKKIKITNVFSETIDTVTYITTMIKNTGDSALVPKLHLEVSNNDVSQVVEQKMFIPSGATEAFESKLYSLPIGTYSGKVKVYYADTITDDYDINFVVSSTEQVPLSSASWILLTGLAMLAVIIWYKKYKKVSLPRK